MQNGLSPLLSDFLMVKYNDSKTEINQITGSSDFVEIIFKVKIKTFKFGVKLFLRVSNEDSTVTSFWKNFEY